jgi:hypothetical protein
VWATHALSPVAVSGDTRWTVHSALSLLAHGNLRLDEFGSQLGTERFYSIECILAGGARIYPVASLDQCRAGHLYHFYPPMGALLAAPLLPLVRAAGAVASPLLIRVAPRSPLAMALAAGDLATAHGLVEVAVASFYIALAAMVLFWVARERLGPVESLVLAAIFAWCTPAWSVASRAMWQHGPSMLALCGALLVLVRAERDGASSRLAGWSGPLLALAFVIRPTNAVVWLAALAYIAWRHRGALGLFVAGSATVYAVFVLYGLSVYGFPVAPYYWPQRPHASALRLHEHLFEALAGNLVSPGRGVFVYVPLFLFSLWGVCRKALGPLRWFAAASIVLHWALISSHDDWWGGFSYGPRYFSDVTPLFVFLLIPALGAASAAVRERRYALPAAIAVLAMVSFAIHLRGATRIECQHWNRTPVSVNENTARLWDWRDPAFLR